MPAHHRVARWRGREHRAAEEVERPWHACCEHRAVAVPQAECLVRVRVRVKVRVRVRVRVRIRVRVGVRVRVGFGFGSPNPNPNPDLEQGGSDGRIAPYAWLGVGAIRN